MTSDDQLVSAYLRRLDAEARKLPRDRRQELVAEITGHIAEARAAAAAAADSRDGGSASVRDILGQLGEPRDIVAAAGPPPAGRPGAHEITAVILLLIGGIVVPVIGWIVGCVLLWTSPRWSRGDKLLGTLVWPGGLLVLPVVFFVLGWGFLSVSNVCTTHSSPSAAAPGAGHPGQVATTTCTGVSLPPWLAITLAAVLLVASVAGPALVAVRLLLRARRVPEASMAGEPDLIPG